MSTSRSRATAKRGERKLVPLFFVAVLLATLAGILPAVGPALRAADVTLSLYGTALAGWSESVGAETNPGPTLGVNEGDRVTMQLTDEDGGLTGGHTFWIDYNANGVIDLATEPSSPVFDTTTILHTFDATVAGTFTYYCGIHSGPPYTPTASAMRGTWITTGRPVVSINAPTAGTSWTGGVAHAIVFSLQSSDPLGSLTVWVNYTRSGGAVGGPIAGPIPGGTNPNTVSWTPVGIDATDVVINVTAVDSGGRRGFRTSAPFEVDSTAPSVVSVTPAAGVTGVPLNAQILVAWSEGMDRAATAATSSIGVVRPSDGSWISGSIAWSADSRQMALTPAQNLNPLTAYRIHVNTSARDDSQPGNAPVAPIVSPFTTGAAVDTAPPVISSVAANPATQVKGDSVNLTADVTDETSLGPVTAHIVGPSLDVNVTMATGGGSIWFFNASYGEAGTHDFTIWAVDAAGNAASSGGSFVIRSLPAPASVAAAIRADGVVVVTWEAVADTGLFGYRVYRGRISGGPYAALTAAPIPPSPREYVDTSVEPGGTYVYVVTAVDVVGNESPFSVEAFAAVPPRPLNALPLIVAAAVTILGAAVVASLWWRRRARRPGDRGGQRPK